MMIRIDRVDAHVVVADDASDESACLCT